MMITAHAPARAGLVGNPSDGYFGKTISFSGEYADPMAGGKLKQNRQVLTITDDDHNEFEMLEKGEDGKEFRGLYIKYTRAK